MSNPSPREIIRRHIIDNNHSDSDYFAAISALVSLRNMTKDQEARQEIQAEIDMIYGLLRDEIITNTGPPLSRVKFGTSGWRGILGKDLNIRTVAFVTAAILSLYRDAAQDEELREALGVSGLEDARIRGCVIGFDNRFGGELLACSAMNVLAANSIPILYAGESTTGALSAMVMESNAAFSINLTPSHNPLEYGGFKYNAADAGPAAPVLTNRITRQANRFLDDGKTELIPAGTDLLRPRTEIAGISEENGLRHWQSLVRKNREIHGIDYDGLLLQLRENNDIVVAVDCVHGASKRDIGDLLGKPGEKLKILRGNEDFTFGGIAPEPSSKNMEPVVDLLKNRSEKYKLGAIIDPDGDRIRFTDGETEISMNQFGAMAYYFLHEVKGKKGMVAKTVATSNFANRIAELLGEEVFEPRVGFKEFKPVIGKALVFFEESDGISIIGHTPEKDAYIGLLLALDMTLSLNKNLGDFLGEIEERFGRYYPDRDGVTVSLQGEELKQRLARLEKYDRGRTIDIGGIAKKITQVITIDGRKMILEDGSWIMIRPSGTEPKVRFYVEARAAEDTEKLVAAAKSMLAEIGLLP